MCRPIHATWCQIQLETTFNVKLSWTNVQSKQSQLAQGISFSRQKAYNMYGGSALGSGKFFGSCLPILFGVQKNFSSLLSYFQIVRQQFSLGHVKEIFELEPEDEEKKQPSGTFCAWEKSISLVDRVWRPRGILNAFWLYLLSPAAISRVWFTDGLW